VRRCRDAGGHDSTSLRAALLLSDAVLIPYPPRTMDVWALPDMAELAALVGGVSTMVERPLATGEALHGH